MYIKGHPKIHGCPFIIFKTGYIDMNYIYTDETELDEYLNDMGYPEINELKQKDIAKGELKNEKITND